MSSEMLAFAWAGIGGPPVPEILEEHLDELGYLSLQRRKFLFSPDLPARRLGWHDERIAAHRDGLGIGGRASVELAATRLDSEDAWVLYAAARTWIEVGSPSLAEVAEKVVATEPKLMGAWREVFRSLDEAAWQRLVPAHRLGDAPPALLPLAVDACGYRGVLSEPDLAWIHAHSSEEVRAAAARHWGTCMVADGVRRLSAWLAAPGATVRRRALWALTLIDRRAALDHVRTDAAHADPFCVRVRGLLGDFSDGPTLLRLTDTATPVGIAAVLALGDLGWCESIEPLIACLSDKAPGRGAAAGVSLEKLLGPLPVARRSEESEDEDLPAVPERAAAVSRAAEVRGTLGSGTKWLRGQAWPWVGDAAEEPMESLWRRSVLGHVPDAAWLRREVPDAWFDGTWSVAARPGE